MSPKRRDEDPWYHVCDCGAKLFAAENPIECPRCGEVLTSKERIKPPWRKRLLNVADAASELSVSRAKLYEMVEKSEISHRRIGASIKFAEEDLEEFLASVKKERRERRPPQPAKSKRRRPLLKSGEQWF